MPDKYDTYTEPIPAINETDFTQKLCAEKSKKSKIYIKF